MTLNQAIRSRDLWKKKYKELARALEIYPEALTLYERYNTNESLRELVRDLESNVQFLLGLDPEQLGHKKHINKSSNDDPGAIDGSQTTKKPT